jgi:UPF0042 nucleotide-binding protein
MIESETSSASEIQLLIVTGMSGAGRSETMRALEDFGYYCVDNLPPRFLLNLVELIEISGRNIRNIAAACDVRSKEFFPELMEVIEELKKRSVNYKIIYLDADDETLVKRFKKDRRKHPLSDTGKIIDGVEKEREILRNLKEIADYIIDTSNLEPYQLKERVRLLIIGSKRRMLLISVTSFGFKFGIPLDSDIVLDVRFLPNPYYEEDLRSLTGLDEKVKEYVLKRVETDEFLRKLFELLDYVIPRYEREGKTHLAIAVGCTGGRHRSVVISEKIAEHLRNHNLNVAVSHRDISKEA